jgi:electron transport complex protein RnfB
VPINRCAPGGEATIAAIAALLDVRAPSPDPAFGTAEPLAWACIDEAACIGCTLCIRACPVDAIVGAGKQMHTVLAGHCTGCGLCLPPCPVDCIVMVSADRAWTPADAAAARARFDSRNARLARRTPGRPPRSDPSAVPMRETTRDQRRKTVAAALERARARRRAA